MKHLLDTDVLINHLRGKKRIDKEIIEDGTAISIITYAELLYGAYKSANQEKSLDIVKKFLNELSIEIINLNLETVDQYAQIKARLETTGVKLDDFDLLIAASALTSSFILVTKNKKHFTRVLDLKIL